MKILHLALLVMLLMGCSTLTTPSSLNYGRTPGYQAFVPAKIAILPCRAWPRSVPITGFPISNASNEDLTLICNEFDGAITGAFTNQPYMRGYSPVAISKFVAAAGKAGLLEGWQESWKRLSLENECLQCQNEPTTYDELIKQRSSWKQWLQSLSQSTKWCDAVLIPFVSFASEIQEDDRGIFRSKRQVGVSLLLIDSNNAELLWSGARQATQTSQSKIGDPQMTYPLYPAWSDLTKSLFYEDLWKEFPGRIVY